MLFINTEPRHKESLIENSEFVTDVPVLKLPCRL